MRMKSLFLWSATLIIFLILAGCFTFVSIDQPRNAMTGETILVKAEVKVFEDPVWGLDITGHHAIVGMMIPVDWVVDSVYYQPGDPGDIGPNVCAYLHPDSSDAEPGGQVDFWTDSLNVHFPPPEGMHWVVYQSLTKDSTVLDTGYVDLFMLFTTGKVIGSFDIGYFVSNAALDFSDPNWYEESLGNTIDVNANQPPVLEPLPELSFEEDDSLSIAVSGWYDFVSDEDPDTLLEFQVQDGQFISGTIAGDSVLFNAPENWWGSDSLNVIVTDTKGLSDTTGIVIEVTSVNDIPVLTLPDTITFVNDSSYDLNLWNAVEDVENGGSTMTFTNDAGSDSLILEYEINGDGWLTLTAPGYAGTTWLAVGVEDPHGGVDTDTSAVVVEKATAIAVTDQPALPEHYVLFQNFPNPFNPLTKIRYGLVKSGTVQFDVYNTLGESIYSRNLGYRAAGFHNHTFNASELGSGVYYFRIEVNGFSGVRKMVVIK